MTIDDSSHTLFDAHFAVDHTDCTTIDHLSTQRYDYAARKEEVSDEPTSLQLDEFKTDIDDDKKRHSQSWLIDSPDYICYLLHLIQMKPYKIGFWNGQ